APRRGEARLGARLAREVDGFGEGGRIAADPHEPGVATVAAAEAHEVIRAASPRYPRNGRLQAVARELRRRERAWQEARQAGRNLEAGLLEEPQRDRGLADGERHRMTPAGAREDEGLEPDG